MKASISPSVRHADLMEMPKILRALETNGADMLHIEVMDGHFAPSLGIGPDLFAAIRKNTKLPLDLHLMVEDPERILPLFSVKKGDIVSVHPETTCRLKYLLSVIRRTGASAYIALNPATPITVLDEVADDIDGVLVMTADPCFPMQKLSPSAITKVSRVRALLDGQQKILPIEVSGGISFANAKILRGAGADIFVADNASVFKGDASIVEGLVRLRTAIG